MSKIVQSISKLNQEQQEAFILDYFKESPESRVLTDKFLSYLFAESNETASQFKELAEQPFYLAKLLDYFSQEGKLPDNLTKLLEFTVKEALQGKRENSRLTELESTRLQQGLSRLAFNLTESAQVGGLEGEQALNWFSEVPRKPKGQATLKPSARHQQEAKNFLKLAENTGLLTRQENKLQFYDDLFQTYFCACYCLNKPFTTSFLGRVSQPTFDRVWPLWAELDSKLERRIKRIAKPSLLDPLMKWGMAFYRYANIKINITILKVYLATATFIAIFYRQPVFFLLAVLYMWLVVVCGLPYFRKKLSAVFALQNLNSYGAVFKGSKFPEIIDASALFNRGVAYGELKQYHKAIQNFSKAIELKPKNILAYWNRGYFYDKLGKYDRAIEEYDKAIELDPKNSKVFNGRGSAYFGLKAYNQAIQDYSKAIELDPKNHNTYSRRGFTYQEMEQYEPAIQDYTTAIELDPNNSRVYSNRGYIYYKLKQYEQAIQDYDMTIKLAPHDPDSYQNRGAVFMELEQNERAVQDYTKAIQLNPNSSENYTTRGVIKLKLKQNQQAMADFTKAIELNPEYYFAFNNRAAVFMELKQYEQAVQDFSKAIELNPEFALGYMNRCKAYLWLRKLEQARLDMAYLWERDQSRVVYGWAVALCKMAETRPTVEMTGELEEIAAVGPEQAEANLCRGVAHLLRREYEAALPELESYIELVPIDWDGYFWKGMTLAYLSRDEEAQAAINQALELKLPPILLGPLRWFQEDRADFYEQYALPLLRANQLI